MNQRFLMNRVNGSCESSDSSQEDFKVAKKSLKSFKQKTKTDSFSIKKKNVPQKMF